jgi:hypothetical protein
MGDDMQFMLIVKTCEDGYTACKPSEDLIAAVASYTQELRKAGALVELSRLHGSSKAARVKLTEDRTVIDGPFAETKELVGGYWIIQVNSMEEAVAWARRVPAPEGRAFEIEVRQFLEVENFFPEAPAGYVTGRSKELARANKQSQ